MSKDCLLLNGNGKPVSYFPLSTIDWKTAINDFLLSLNTFTILLGVACSVIILGPTLGFPLPVAFVLATIIGLSYGLYQYSNQKCVMNAVDHFHDVAILAPIES